MAEGGGAVKPHTLGWRWAGEDGQGLVECGCGQGCGWRGRREAGQPLGECVHIHLHLRVVEILLTFTVLRVSIPPTPHTNTHVHPQTHTLRETAFRKGELHIQLNQCLNQQRLCFKKHRTTLIPISQVLDSGLVNHFPAM